MYRFHFYMHVLHIGIILWHKSYVACPDPIQYRRQLLRPKMLVPDGGNFIPPHRPHRFEYRTRDAFDAFGSDLLLRLPEFTDRRASYSPEFSSLENLYCEPSIQVGRREINLHKCGQ